MEHEVSTSQQDSPPNDSQPILATLIETKAPKRKRQSRMPLGVKASVAAMAAQNATISDISRTCDIDRATVRTILSQADIQQHVEEVRSDFVLAGDLWKARKVMRQKLNKGSESAATTILRGFNVLQSNPKVEINIANIGAQTYAQRMQARQAEATTTNSDETPLIDVKPADKS